MARLPLFLCTATSPASQFIFCSASDHPATSASSSAAKRTRPPSYAVSVNAVYWATKNGSGQFISSCKSFIPKMSRLFFPLSRFRPV